MTNAVQEVVKTSVHWATLDTNVLRMSRISDWIRCAISYALWGPGQVCKSSSQWPARMSRAVARGPPPSHRETSGISGFLFVVTTSLVAIGTHNDMSHTEPFTFAQFARSNPISTLYNPVANVQVQKRTC